MFENLKNIFKKNRKKELVKSSSKDTAKERLHLVLMQDRANVSADFLDLMRKEIIEVIKKYIDIDEKAIDVRLTSETTEDGTQCAPALYANIPIINIKEEARKFGNEETENKKKVEAQNRETQEQNSNEENVSDKKEEIVEKDDKQETTKDETKDNSDKEAEQEVKENESENQEQSEEEIKKNEDMKENQNKQSTEKEKNNEENNIEKEKRVEK